MTNPLIAQLEKLQSNLVYIRSFLKKDGVLSDPEEVKIYRDLEIAKRNLKDFLFASLPQILQALRVQEAALRYINAFEAVDKGILGFDLHNNAVMELRTAGEAWHALQSNQEGEPRK